jgi:hypothetical protein
MDASHKGRPIGAPSDSFTDVDFNQRSGCREEEYAMWYLLYEI